MVGVLERETLMCLCEKRFSLGEGRAALTPQAGKIAGRLPMCADLLVKFANLIRLRQQRFVRLQQFELRT
jgi:hypothetical protein